MKAFAARGASNLPLIHHKHFDSNDVQSRFLYKIPLLPKQIIPGLHCHCSISPKSMKSDEKASNSSLCGSEPDHMLVAEDSESSEEKQDDDFPVNDASQEGSWMDNSKQLFKFLEDFDIKNIKLDSEGTYPILVLSGGGAVVALWLAASVVSAVDSIPVFPKVLELIGLGYTIWFSSRYLIFKDDRDELFEELEQIKLQVFGSKDD